MTRSRRPEPPLEILERMRHPVPMEERPNSEARRRASIDVIAGAIRRGPPRRFDRIRWLLLGAAAALVATGAAWLAHPSPERPAATSASGPARVASSKLDVVRGTAVVKTGDRSSTLASDGTARLADGDAVTTTADAEASLLLPRGVRIKLASSTELSLTRVLETEQRLRLGRGYTEISVPRPGGPGVFSVDTPDSQVVVHGTEFSVRVEQDPRTNTFETVVSVTRGSVFVSHDGEQRLLELGTTWSSHARDTAPPPATAFEPQASPPLTPPGRPKAAHAAVAPPSLAEQNRLFQAFLDARAAGDDARAVRMLDELLTRFPDTPLADQARLGRFRALQRLGQSTTGQP